MSTIELFSDRSVDKPKPLSSSTPKKKKQKLIGFTDKKKKDDNKRELIEFKGTDQIENIPEDSPAVKDEFDEDRELYHTADPQNFRPKLYTFKFPLKVKPKQTYSVLAPPFWILVDHLIAVVWHLYSGEDTEKVGIVHLQWALEFSKWIKDQNGAMPTAVRSLIMVIEDALMEKYTNLSKIRPTKVEYDFSAASVPGKEGEMNTSITLDDILSRSPGVSEKALIKGGKKAVVSKASGTQKDKSEESKGEPATITPIGDDQDIIKFLKFLSNYQKVKVKKEEMFLQEIEKAYQDFSSNKGDVNKLLMKLEEKFQVKP